MKEMSEKDNTTHSSNDSNREKRIIRNYTGNDNKMVVNNENKKYEELQELIGMPPYSIKPIVIILISAIVLCLLSFSYWFKYPDIVSAKIKITSTSPPARIKAKANGRFAEIYSINKQNVKKGELIGVIENLAQTKDVIQLKNQIQQILFDSINIGFFNVSNEIHLGDIQQPYLEFRNHLYEYLKFENLKYHNSKKKIIKEQIILTDNNYQRLIDQLPLVKKKLHLAHSYYKRDSILNCRSSITAKNFEESKSKYLQSILTYQDQHNTIDQTKLNILQKEEQLINLENEYISKKNQLKSQLHSALDKLHNSIKTWEQNYCLIAPMDGVVIFDEFWNENHNIKVGDDVLTVVSSTNNSSIIGKASFNPDNIGKIRLQQEAHISFSQYPKNEFGIVKGTVNYISQIPTSDGKYIIEVSFPDGLTSSYGIEIPLSQEMEASVDIITDKQRLIERLFSPLREILKRNMH
jgi:HlyD family secretion protein